MNIRWILLAISVVIFVGPIGTALVIYRDNLAALVMPEDIESLKSAPEITFVGVDPLNSSLLKFKIVNPYGISLSLNSISAEVFCSEHNLLLGFANETASVSIPAESSAIISLVLTFSSQGAMHIRANHLGRSELNVDFRNLTLDIQGIKLNYEEGISFRIPTPTSL